MTLLSIRDSRAFDGTSQIAHPQPITRTWHKTEPTNSAIRDVHAYVIQMYDYELDT